MRLSRLGIAVPLALVLMAPVQAAPTLPFSQPELLGQFVVPVGLWLDGKQFGGISGLDYDAANDLYYAISDDRSQNGPARFYVLKIMADDTGVHGIDVVATHVLTDLEGKPFAEKGVDPESIRLAADGKTLFWSSERDEKGMPAIFEADLDGKALRSFSLPEAYLPDADGTKGIYSNLAFEGLTLSLDGKLLYAGTENALVQDGPKATLEAGSPSRFLALDIASGTVAAEYVYGVDPISFAATAEPGYNDNGLSELEQTADGDFVVVERTFGSGVGNQIRFYVASTAGATDIAGATTISGMDVTQAEKALWFTIGEGDFGLDIDNVEDFTWGPDIGGKKTFVIASDDNFNPDGQFTQFTVFAYDELK